MAYDSTARLWALSNIGGSSSGVGTSVEIVDTLPTSDISETTIYFVLKTNEETNDTYDEYMYINSEWEMIGTTSINLNDYVTESELEAETTAIYQVTANLLASINATNVDVADVNSEIDEIDQNLIDINDAIDDIEGDILTLSNTTTTLTTGLNNVKRTVVINGDATFLAVDNYEYYWGEIGAIIPTFPTPTDMAIPHEIVLYFKSGSTATVLTLPQDVVVPSDFTIEASKTYELNFKYFIDEWVMLDSSRS